MSTTVQRRVVPLLLGLCLLAILVAVGLSANTGALKADSSCQYGTCPTGPTGNGSTPLWAWAAIGIIVFLAVLVTALLVLRRRRQPPASDLPPGAGAGTAISGGPSGPESPEPPESTASYVEGPEDVAAPSPELPAAAAAVAGGAAAGGAFAASGVASAPAAEGETNIDALMDELDRISGEILRKDKPKGPTGTPPETP